MGRPCRLRMWRADGWSYHFIEPDAQDSTQERDGGLGPSRGRRAAFDAEAREPIDWPVESTHIDAGRDKKSKAASM